MRVRFSCAVNVPYNYRDSYAVTCVLPGLKLVVQDLGFGTRLLFRVIWRPCSVCHNLLNATDTVFHQEL